MFFAQMILYTMTRFFVRASIILFYLRVFPPRSDNKLGRIVQFTMGFNVVYNISFLFAVIFQCSPNSFFWTQWDGLHEGHCGNATILMWVAAATGIAFDLWLLALPFSQLLALNLHWKKKVMGGLMFFVGVACVPRFLVPFSPERQAVLTKQQRHDHQPGPPQGHRRVHPRRLQPHKYVLPSPSSSTSPC